MVRTAGCLIALVLIAGCIPQHSDPKPKKPSVSTATQPDPQVLIKNSDSDEPKTPSAPPQTFTPVEDKEIAALQDVSVEELITHLANSDKRGIATKALIKRGSDAAPALITALSSENPQARAAAAFALGEVGKESGEAKEALRKMAETDDSEVARDAALFALDALEGK